MGMLCFSSLLLLSASTCDGRWSYLVLRTKELARIKCRFGNVFFLFDSSSYFHITDSTTEPNTKVALNDLLAGLDGVGKEWQRLKIVQAALPHQLNNPGFNRTTSSLMGKLGDTTLSQLLVLCTLVPRTASEAFFVLSSYSQNTLLWLLYYQTYPLSSIADGTHEASESFSISLSRANE